MLQRGLISLLSTSTTVIILKFEARENIIILHYLTLLSNKRQMYLNKLLFAYVTNHPKIKCLKIQDSVSWKLGQKNS